MHGQSRRTDCSFAAASFADEACETLPSRAPLHCTCHRECRDDSWKTFPPLRPASAHLGAGSQVMVEKQFGGLSPLRGPLAARAAARKIDKGPGQASAPVAHPG